MKLPRTENTALLLALTLAEAYKKEPISLTYISKKHGVSVLFLKKLARSLRKNNLIVSKEGVGGGYVLRISPEKISVWDIVDAVTQIEKNDTPIQTACPINKYCLPQNIQKTIDLTLKKSLSAISLEDLL